MSSLWDKVLSECGRGGDERSARNIARRLGVKRPAVFSVLFSLREASLVTSSKETHGTQKRMVRQRLMWRKGVAQDAQDPATPPDV